MAASARDVRFFVLGASLARASLNNRLATLAAATIREPGGSADFADIADFESLFYDQDVERELGIFAGTTRFCERLKRADGLILASPRYASMRGVIKNLIDWVSRFRPQPFKGGQALLLSASPSIVGGSAV